jgi:indole-3-glycerol phosphate synthase
MEKSISMAEKIGNAAVRIAESGITGPEDILRFRKYGFIGFNIYNHKQEHHSKAQSYHHSVQETFKTPIFTHVKNFRLNIVISSW